MSGTIEVTSIAVPESGYGRDPLGRSQADTVTIRNRSGQRMKRKNKGCDTILTFLSQQIAGIGLIASVCSTVLCSYFHVNGAPQNQSNSLGIWNVQMNATEGLFSCTSYPSGTALDGRILTSRVMSILAPTCCFGGIVMAYFAETGQPIRHERRIYLSIFFLLLASVMQSLTLMILESDVCLNNPLIPGDGTCGMAAGATISIVAAGMMVAACFLLLVTGRKEIEYDTSDPAASARADPPVQEPTAVDAYDRVSQEGGGSTQEEELDPATGEATNLPLKHGTGKIKYIDVWGKLV